jgi:hypothetical protein
LIKLVDTVNKTLTLGKKGSEVVIDLKKVARKVFLIPNKGKPIPIKHFVGGRNTFKTQELCSESTGSKMTKNMKIERVTDYIKRLVGCGNMRPPIGSTCMA